MIKYVQTIPSLPGNMHTPVVIFDGSKIEIKGRSTPEYANLIWDPIIDALLEYIKSQEVIQILFKLEYFNSASSRFISDFFVSLAQFRLKCDLSIYWYYLENDEDSEYYGELYQSANPLLKIKLIKTNDLWT